MKTVNWGEGDSLGHALAYERGISLRGANFGFWSHLGCSGQNSIIFSREGLVEGCTRKNIKKYIFLQTSQPSEDARLARRQRIIV